MSALKNLLIKVGDKFQTFTVVGTTKRWQKTRWRTFFICDCICGNQVFRTSAELKKQKNDRCHKCYSKSITTIAVSNVKIGDQFGYWEVLSRSFSKNNVKYVDCKCRCGLIKPVHLYNLAYGKTKGCSSCSSSRNNLYNRLKENFIDIISPRDLIGKKIGKRLVLDYVLLEKGYHYKVQCVCGEISNIRQARIQNYEALACRNCNKTDIAEVGTIFGKRKITAIQIIGGRRKYTAICECGHIMTGSLSKFKNRDACVSCAQRRVGPIRKVILGYDPKITGIWHHIFDRCYNEQHHAYHLYGGRGIKVHSRYYDMQNFVDDIGPRPSVEHSIDRIDPDGDYAPGNIRWADKREQARNRRMSRKNRHLYLTVKKENLCKKCLNKCLKQGSKGTNDMIGIDPISQKLFPD